MRVSAVREGLVGVYALAAFGVVVAPALVLWNSAARGGIAPSLQALDLVVVSTVVGLGYAVVAYRRLRRQSTETRSRANTWIAAVHALVVLALLASALLAVVLHGLGIFRAPLAEEETPLLLLWALVHVAAVAVAEGVERAVFRWLTAPDTGRAARRGGPLSGARAGRS